MREQYLYLSCPKLWYNNTAWNKQAWYIEIFFVRLLIITGLVLLIWDINTRKKIIYLLPLWVWVHMCLFWELATQTLTVPQNLSFTKCIQIKSEFSFFVCLFIFNWQALFFFRAVLQINWALSAELSCTLTTHTVFFCSLEKQHGIMERIQTVEFRDLSVNHNSITH